MRTPPPPSNVQRSFRDKKTVSRFATRPHRPRESSLASRVPLVRGRRATHALSPMRDTIARRPSPFGGQWGCNALVGGVDTVHVAHVTAPPSTTRSPTPDRVALGTPATPRFVFHALASAGKRASSRARRRGPSTVVVLASANNVTMIVRAGVMAKAKRCPRTFSTHRRTLWPSMHTSGAGDKGQAVAAAWLRSVLLSTVVAVAY